MLQREQLERESEGLTGEKLTSEAAMERRRARVERLQQKHSAIRDWAEGSIATHVGTFV